MIITNYSYINKPLGRAHSGVTNPMWIFNASTMRNFYCQDSTPNIEQIKRDSFPTGTNPPYSLILGDKGALLSSTTTINGESTVAANVAMGRAISASLEGSSSISTANLSLVVQLACSLIGTGSLSAAMQGKVEMAAALAGSGNITAGLNLLANVVASLTGTGGVTAALRGTASMEADITPFSELSPESLAAAVWNALAASYNTAGTMGNKMNSAASAGDPWGTPLPGAYAPGTAGEILGNMSGGGSSETRLREDELAQGGTTHSITLNASASPVNDYYAYNIIAIVGGTGEGQSNIITRYYGGTKEARVSTPWRRVPDATSLYRILPLGFVDIRRNTNTTPSS